MFFIPTCSLKVVPTKAPKAVKMGGNDVSSLSVNLRLHRGGRPRKVTTESRANKKLSGAVKGEVA